MDEFTLYREHIKKKKLEVLRYQPSGVALGHLPGEGALQDKCTGTEGLNNQAELVKGLVTTLHAPLICKFR